MNHISQSFKSSEYLTSFGPQQWVLILFLRPGVPAFYKPITKLFNMSLAHSFVPRQWKQASILLYQKHPPPASRQLSANFNHSCFNPCHGADSRTTMPVSSLLVTILTFTLSYQFAFCPTGSQQQLSVSSASSPTCYSPTPMP